ncbi:MAG: ArsR/SmtB family transcription factor [Pyrinomonadaceae bacterium]
MKETLTPEAIVLIAERFSILSEPLRLQILQLLRGGESSVSRLTTSLETSQPNASKHLKILQNAGIIGREQRGNSVYYSIIDQSIFELCELVCGSLETKYREKAKIFSAKQWRKK